MKYDLTGYNIDNLLKTLYAKKVTLLNVERIGQTRVKFELPNKFDRKAKKYIANFRGTKTPSFFKRLPKILLANLGLVIALFVGLTFFLFSSNYTWQIRIFGLKDLNENDIIKVLEQNGVRKGKINLKSSKEIETILLENYDKLAQVSVVKQGTALIVNLSEKLVYVEEIFEPIKAKYCGIITKINIITGTTNVKIGDYVNVGDSLVLPFNLDASGNKVSVKPMAEIEAQIFVLGSANLQKQETVLTRTGKKQLVYDYYIFNRHLFSGKNKNSFVFFENVSYNKNVSNLLPIKRKITCFYELAPSVVEHDLQAEKQAVIEKSQQDAKNKIPQDLEVCDEQIQTQIVNDCLFAYTTLTLQGRINDWIFWRSTVR